MEKVHTFELVDIKQETEDIKSFVFSVDEQADFSWKAGQYLDWQIPHDNPDDRGERRWFSISSAPSEGVVMLSCRFANDGSTLKKRLAEMHVGDKIQASGPMGDFTLDDIEQRTVLIAGGIGITPFRSIIKELASKNALRNLTLIHGNRVLSNVPFFSEMNEIAENEDGFTLHYTYSPTIINAEMVKSMVNTLTDTVYMISGLEKMVDSIKQSLLLAGVAEDKIRIDDFGGYDWHLAKQIY